MLTDRTALLSDCGRFRYVLTRSWHRERPPVAWVMLNPSMADANVDDPTIRRVVSFSRQWGFGSVVVFNLFAFRATSPKALKAAGYPVGPDNDPRIADATVGIEKVICAWGANSGAPARAAQVVRLLRSFGCELLRFDTQHPHPPHPLYIPASTSLRRLDEAAS